ncbi:MAG: hypothetical protein L3J89_12540 [Gammaproteobacteria bacterium]|nr:hypothetical protein [Gammaproteobacteria bacterium]
MRKLFILIGFIPFVVQAEVPDDLLARTVAQLNKHTPLTLDDETRLDGVSGKNRVLAYEYTLVNYAKTELDLTILESNIAPVVTSGACAETSMKPLFDSGVSVHYHYKGKAGESLILVKVTPSDCQ